MRRTTLLSGLATAALLATAATVPTAAAAAPGASGDPFTRAVAQLKAHSGAGLAADGQSFTLRQVATDADGTEHVRLNRYSTACRCSAVTSWCTSARATPGGAPARA